MFVATALSLVWIEMESWQSNHLLNAVIFIHFDISFTCFLSTHMPQICNIYDHWIYTDTGQETDNWNSRYSSAVRLEVGFPSSALPMWNIISLTNPITLSSFYNIFAILYGDLSFCNDLGRSMDNKGKWRQNFPFDYVHFKKSTFYIQPRWR